MGLNGFLQETELMNASRRGRNLGKKNEPSLASRGLSGHPNPKNGNKGLLRSLALNPKP